MTQIMPLEDPGAFNQALMDLGATVCLPNGAPLCEECPIRQLCLACQQGSASELPVKAPKKPRRIEERQVYLILHQGKAALRQRPKKGLLAGLWELPNAISDGTDPLSQWGILPTSRTSGGQGKHIFTHIEWRMGLEIIQTDTDQLPDGWVWANGREIREIYPIPNAFDSFRGKLDEYLDQFGGVL
jgi:A/G-specific adenine glycosylase